MSERTAIIVLAAGTASRMGQPKQLLPWRETTLLQHAVTQAIRVPQSHVYVVAGAYFKRVEQEVIDLAIKIVHNVNYRGGLGTSIAAGVQAALREDPPYEYIAVTLVDQPAVTTEYLTNLIDLATKSESIVATRYGERAGVPAVFPSEYFGRLAQLKGDKGASELLNAQDAPVRRIDPTFDVYDIDTLEDYQRYAGN